MGLDGSGMNFVNDQPPFGKDNQIMFAMPFCQELAVASIIMNPKLNMDLIPPESVHEYFSRKGSALKRFQCGSLPIAPTKRSNFGQ